MREQSDLVGLILADQGSYNEIERPCGPKLTDSTTALDFLFSFFYVKVHSQGK